MPQSILWYDLETFGLHPHWDRIAQFGAVRTDDQFNELEPPAVFYCRPAVDVLPNPESCLITGITPQEASSRGLAEPEFARQIYDLMTVRGTCVAGFNSVRFDDEFIRALFFRNFFDPYEREWDRGNSRWDVLNLVRMARDLRPDGIVWPLKDDGRPDTRLESLCQANGLDIHRAHDALSDVRATIALARLVYERQKRLFKFHFSLRKKEKARRLLSLTREEPIVHSHALHSTSAGSNTTLVLPLSMHPVFENVFLVCDLQQDPEVWASLPAETIRDRILAPKDSVEPEQRPRIMRIHTNRCPAIAPLGTLDMASADRLQIDVELCRSRARWLRSRPELVQKVRTVFSQPPVTTPRDVELRIYADGFWSDGDRTECEEIRETDPADLLSGPAKLHDPRGAELLWRFVARNYPEVLSAKQANVWKSQCAARILNPEPEGVMDFATFRRVVRSKLESVETPAENKPVLQQLLEYGNEIERSILT